MRLREKLKKVIRRVPWRRAAMGLAALAVTGGVVAGFVGGTASVAADECDPNDVMPCGASGAPEFIGKITGELGAVYAHFGLPASDYERFKNEAVEGFAKKDGTVVDDKGNVVMTEAWSIGRTDFDFAEDYPIGETTFHKSVHATTPILVSDLPVSILFDDKGTAQFAVIKSCGNPIMAKKVKSAAECKDLVKEPVKDKKNTFRFTTVAEKTELVEFVKFEYFVDEGDGEQLFATTESPDTPVERTFTKDATVRVKITVSVPGKKQRVIVSDACVKEIKVEKKEKEKEKEEVPVKVLSVSAPKPPAALPVTGPAGLAGLFAGVSAAGAVGHHMFIARRRKLHE